MATRTLRVSLSDLIDPEVSHDHYLRYKYKKNESGDQVDLVFRIKEGATTIASWSHTDIPTTLTRKDQLLTSSEAAAISDYTNLDVEIEQTVVDGSDQYSIVTWVKFQVPLEVQLSATAVGRGTTSAELTIPNVVELSASAKGVGSTGAELTVGVALSAEATGVGSTDASLTVSATLSATAVGVGSTDAELTSGLGSPDELPIPKKIHKLEETIPSGSLTHVVNIGATIDPEKTWVILHTRTQDASKADDAMVGYVLHETTIELVRSGGIGDITAVIQLVEFDQGVRVQHKRYSSPVNWNNVTIPISEVDLDKTFLTIKVTAENDEFEGYDIIGEMWVRGKFQDSTTVILDHNQNTIGDSPEPVEVFIQVVEFATGARVWSRDVSGIDISDTFRTADILDDIGLDDPPRLDQTFMVFSNRLQSDSSGSSPRVDFWSMNGFLFNGTGGIWRAGGDEGEKKDVHIFIVELDFVYIESYNISGHNSGVVEPQTIEQELGSIRDASNSVAFIPWNQWGGFVEEESPTTQKFWTTVEVSDKDTLKIKRGNGSALINSLEVYVMEFDEPPATDTIGSLEIKEIYSGQEDFEENIFGQKPFERIVSLPAPVDQSKSIVWATAHGHDTDADVCAWIDFDDDSTIRIHLIDTDENLTSVTWYLLEFETGISVQRGSFGDSEFSNRHASAVIDPVDTARAFIIGQWGEFAPHASVWLGGARQVRAFYGASGSEGNVQHTPVAWQVVEVNNDGEVHHFGKAWKTGEDLVEELALGSGWDADSLFVWATEHLAKEKGLQHFDVKPDESKVVVTRLDNGDDSGAAIEVVNLGTFVGLVPQREHHFVEIVLDEFHIHEEDIALDHSYDVDKTVAWVPMAGNFLVPANNVTEYPGAVRLEMVGPSTLRAYASHFQPGVSSLLNVGDQWEGYVYVLGFVEGGNGGNGGGGGDCPPTACPEGIEVEVGPCESGIEVVESPCPEGAVTVFRKDGGIDICPRGE